MEKEDHIIIRAIIYGNDNYFSTIITEKNNIFFSEIAEPFGFRK